MFICKGMKEFLSTEVWPRLSLFSFRKSLKIMNTCILDHPGKWASIPEPKRPLASGGSLSSLPAEGAWSSVMVEETFLMGLGFYYLLLLSSQLVAECAKLFSLHFTIVLHCVNKNASLQELQVVAGIWGWGENAGEGKTGLFLYPQGLAGVNSMQDVVHLGLVFTWFISNNSATGMWLSQLFTRSCMWKDQTCWIFFNMSEELTPDVMEPYNPRLLAETLKFI